MKTRDRAGERRGGEGRRLLLLRRALNAAADASPPRDTASSQARVSLTHLLTPSPSPSPPLIPDFSRPPRQSFLALVLGPVASHHNASVRLLIYTARLHKKRRLPPGSRLAG